MISARKITYISGTRADFGLMRNCLLRMHSNPEISLSVLVTGMHLSADHGNTVSEIKAAGLPVLAELAVCLSPANSVTMSMAMGAMITGFTTILAQNKPDILLLLGDRGEMLAGAIVALNLGIPVAHIHGGERSGTIDESIRHAISKLSHIHLVATDQSRQRLIRMGENPLHVHCTGAPGLDGLCTLPRISRPQFAQQYDLDPSQPIALVVFHPVVQESEQAALQTQQLLASLDQCDLQSVVLLPNSDSGSDAIRNVWHSASTKARLRLFKHLPREDFSSVMSWADIMVGNSSAGIIEASSFGIPVINIGSRQNLRERNANITEIAVDSMGADLPATIRSLLKRGPYPTQNCYGDGQAGERIVRVLLDTPLNSRLLEKVNAY